MPEELDVTALGGRLVLVGYSGRDRAAVQAHVDELARHGVPEPAEVPAVWEVPLALLAQTEVVRVGRGTSGEAEPVIVVSDGDAWLTVGSDHTDRELERTSMDDAKRACQKVVARHRWKLPDDDAWDRLVLRSSIEVDGRWEPYQESTLDALLPPSWFTSRFGGDGDVVVFCGTVATVGDLVTRATAFRAELEDPATAETLVCVYRIDDGGG